MIKATKREHKPVLGRLGALLREPHQCLEHWSQLKRAFSFRRYDMLQPAKLSSLLDIRDELKRDVCQLMFLNKAIMSLFNQDVDQEIIDGVS